MSVDWFDWPLTACMQCMHNEHGHTAPVVLGNNAAATQKKARAGHVITVHNSFVNCNIMCLQQAK
jgi:hypothetical protein